MVEKRGEERRGGKGLETLLLFVDVTETRTCLIDQVIHRHMNHIFSVCIFALKLSHE